MKLFKVIFIVLLFSNFTFGFDANVSEYNNTSEIKVENLQSKELAKQTQEQKNIDLSFKSLYSNAHFIVKSVIWVLISFSIITWTIFFAKSIQFRIGFVKIDKDIKELQRIDSDISLNKLQYMANLKDQNSFLNLMTLSLYAEILKSDTKSKNLKHRLEILIENSLGKIIAESKVGISVFASIGSNAPFIGLFGTVWGIMNSFVGIANSNNASLAVVAPGIAEALFATAIGLLSAIPAVLIYNYFVKLSSKFGTKLQIMANELYVIVLREIEKDENSNR